MEQPRIEKEMMIMLLLSSLDMPTVKEIARKVHTSPSTVYRNIRSWKDQGFSITKRGRGIYHITMMPKELADFKNMVYFTEEEAYIINSMIAALDESNALKQNIMKKLASIYECTNLANYGYRKETSKNIRSLTRAVERRRKVILEGYSSSHSQTVRHRLVEPYAFTANFQDIWCYDIEAQVCKIFKVTRISNVKVLEELWEFESLHKQETSDLFRIHGDSMEHVVLEMGVMAKNLIMEEFPMSPECIKPRNGKWILDTMVYGSEGIARFIIGLASDIRIIKGKRLKEYIGNYVRSYLKEYID